MINKINENKEFIEIEQSPNENEEQSGKNEKKIDEDGYKNKEDKEEDDDDDDDSLNDWEMVNGLSDDDSDKQDLRPISNTGLASPVKSSVQVNEESSIKDRFSPATKLDEPENAKTPIEKSELAVDQDEFESKSPEIEAGENDVLEPSSNDIEEQQDEIKDELKSGELELEETEQPNENTDETSADSGETQDDQISTDASKLRNILDSLDKEMAAYRKSLEIAESFEERYNDQYQTLPKSGSQAEPEEEKQTSSQSSLIISLV